MTDLGDLDHHQHEVREWGAEDQEGSVEVYRDRLAVRPKDITFLVRQEIMG